MVIKGRRCLWYGYTGQRDNSCLDMKEQDKNSSHCYWIIIKHLGIFFRISLFNIFFWRGLQFRTEN